MADLERAVDSDKVWTTLITNTDYLPGLLTLDYSLKRAGSKYPLVVLYTDTFPLSGHAALDARGIPKQHIEYLVPSSGSKNYDADPRFYDCWSKLVPFSLTQYKRIVQLDADMLVLRNMDELMDLELDEPGAAAAATTSSQKQKHRRVFAAGHACVCNPLKKPHYPSDWTPANCAFTSQHADPDAAQTSAPAPDSPAAGPLGFMNGGLQVVNPSAALFSQIVTHMDADGCNMDFADQSLLSGLYHCRWVALPYVYNALKTLRWDGVHAPIWRDECVKNVHFIMTPKPWEDKVDEKGRTTSQEITHRWWNQIDRQRISSEREMGLDEDGY
ncbi:nucleotide-diphospho-sugar transferase [Podospora didyma]|uniref:Nucleotide-diphospho-sugar transferase n=1 Tax=Podospora didyma TaxID=330526 RepID=A0AAE0KKH0_9PEZI|nr:nucleotide-diphospho-sugar transferase [Podospora didyma]